LQVILQNYWGRVNKYFLRMELLLLISVFSLPVLSYASTNATPLDDVIDRTRQMQLGKHKAWLNLLHYKSTLLGPRQSQVDDEDFFLAADGAHNPQAELEANLRGFFSFKTTAHPRCLFPARFHWLNSKLKFSADLPVMDCPKFNAWKEKFQTDQVTLLFPSMYLDNPASMFGHTFIRFDRTDRNHLLSYTLSYAASYDETDNMLVYSWNGIFGGYQGKFYLQEYYNTLQRYSDIEQRDIWEYQLNLNQKEIDQLLRHLWEVRTTTFDYFFFRENCSYRLLALLDVARENINMSIDAYPLYAIPVDTVRDVEKAGLINERYYRPSTHHKISQMVEQIGEAATQAAISLADVSNVEQSIDSRVESFSINQQAQIFQLADELLNQNKTLTSPQEKLQLEILSARSNLSVKREDIEFSFNGIPPEVSHKSARWNISTGKREMAGNNSERFYELGIRPAFHDLLDVAKGFIDGASIRVLETELRWYQQQEKIKLQNLNIFSLQSIVPVKPWSKPLSRKISFKLKQRDINVSEQALKFESQFSIGYGSELKNTLVYALATGQFDYATELNKNYGLYLGADFGGLWSFSASDFSGQTEANYQLLQQISGEPGDIQKLNLGVQFNLLKEHAIRLDYEKTQYELFDVNEIKLSYLMYF